MRHHHSNITLPFPHPSSRKLCATRACQPEQNGNGKVSIDVPQVLRFSTPPSEDRDPGGRLSPKNHGSEAREVGEHEGCFRQRSLCQRVRQQGDACRLSGIELLVRAFHLCSQLVRRFAAVLSTLLVSLQRNRLIFHVDGQQRCRFSSQA